MLAEYEKELINKAKKENKRFESLYLKHEDFKKKLKEIDKISILTTAMEIERKNIKKLKLLNKEKMTKILDNLN